MLMSMASDTNFNEVRLALFEHLQGELMMLLGIDVSKLTKEELRRELDSIGDVCDAVLEILAIDIVEVKDGVIHAKINVPEPKRSGS